MQILSHNGCQYRTRLMDRARADRFARCLHAHPHFTGAMVCESDRAKNPVRRYFVAYHPSNPERCADLLQQQEDQRRAKAETEGRDYLFCLDKDGGRPFFWCLSTSGEVYEVDAHSCTCPDFQHRCLPAGIKCKHILALEAGNSTVLPGFEAVRCPEPQPEPESGLTRPSRPEECPLCDGWEFVQRTNHPLTGQRCPTCHPAFRTVAA